jgi:ethanolamine utilization protein EutN
VILGRVVGTVVSTAKHFKVEGCKLLLVQPLEPGGEPRGNPLITIDAVDAGVGDRVLVVQEGRAVALAAGRTQTPLDAAVIGVVDAVDLP